MTEHVPAFLLRQRLTMMVNRYDVLRAEPGWKPGDLLATAQQKRMAFREQVTFYEDAERTRPVFGFRARQKVDLGASYDVTDATGAPIGSFRKDFAKSLLRSTFHLSAPGVEAVGQERNQTVALVRRFAELPLPFGFAFADDTGRTVMTSEKKLGVRDTYRIQVTDERLDWRVASAMAVGLDALMAREGYAMA